MRVLEWLSRRGKAGSVDRAVEEYQANVTSGWPSLDQYWAELGSSKTPSILAALVKVDLRRRFEAGERPRVLEYLREFPILTEDSNRVISLVYEEFCLLEEIGEKPDSLAFCEAYGPWRDSLRSQLVYHRELSRAVGAESPPVNFPELGERFAQYRLTSLLGVGGVARVYLATEDELGGRRVAIKVTASFGQEPSILAKLDHRNIVPILTVAESESGLRGICMPYRPGVTLEELIKRIGRGTPPRAARAISDALYPRDSPVGFPPEEQRVGWSDFRIDRTFSEAVAWIGLALADALSYLHDQGVFHRDIKPANILLAYREGPQLLDFNLAQVPNNPEGASAAQKGGTLPYMAPEQLKAFIDPSAWGDVESTADLYSLGLVLRELLTGRPPELPTSQGSLAREIQSLIDRRLAPSESITDINPGVPPALESIVGKCLAFRPEDRYATANDLAVDLRQFLDRKPLLVAPNTSKIELGVNWASRNRHGVLSAIVFLAILPPLFWLLPRSEPVPAQVIQAEPPGEKELRQAESLLDSSIRENWVLAKGMFEKLRGERNETARSSLGLALTLLKLNDPKDKDRANNLLKDAAGERDAEQVIRARLKKEPKSAILHLVLGILLSKKSLFDASKEPDYDLARKSLVTSLEIDPKKGFSAHVVLASVEESTKRYQNALRHLAKAIELGQENDVKAGKIYELRKAMLRILVELIDERLEDGINVEDRVKASSYCRELESQLDFFEDDWADFAVEDKRKGHSYAMAYYEGCLFSIRGVLEYDGEHPAESVDLFDQASQCFEEARELVPFLSTNRDRPPLLKPQEEKLSDRRKLVAFVP